MYLQFFDLYLLFEHFGESCFHQNCYGKIQAALYSSCHPHSKPKCRSWKKVGKLKEVGLSELFLLKSENLDNVELLNTGAQMFIIQDTCNALEKRSSKTILSSVKECFISRTKHVICDLGILLCSLATLWLVS